MDPIDNPGKVKRSTEDSAEPTTASTSPQESTNEAQTRDARKIRKQPYESESPIQALVPNPDTNAPIDEARREKVERLKKAIADGTYSVSAEEVARKLIEHMLEPKE